MGQRVNVTVASRLTGRSENTIRAWVRSGELSADEAGHHAGHRVGKQIVRGVVREIDVDELRLVHQKHGGTRWYVEHLPAEDLAVRVARLEEELRELRAQFEAPATRMRPPASAASMILDGALDLSSGAPSDLPLVRVQGHIEQERQRTPARARPKANTVRLRDEQNRLSAGSPRRYSCAISTASRCAPMRKPKSMVA